MCTTFFKLYETFDKEKGVEQKKKGEVTFFSRSYSRIVDVVYKLYTALKPSRYITCVQTEAYSERSYIFGSQWDNLLHSIERYFLDHNNYLGTSDASLEVNNK